MHIHNMLQHEKGETCLSVQRRGIDLYYIDINIRVPYLVFIDVTAFWLGPRNFNNRLITEVNELYIEKWSMSILKDADSNRSLFNIL